MQERRVFCQISKHVTVHGTFLSEGSATWLPILFPFPDPDIASEERLYAISHTHF